MSINFHERNFPHNKVLIKMCHCCGNIMESVSEIMKCSKCHKSFLPSNYFEKIKGQHQSQDYSELFSPCQELSEEDLIKGIQVLW